MKILIIGVGNPWRRDDGLGPALVERLAGSLPQERSVVEIIRGTAVTAWTYQLNIEDAHLVKDNDLVIFADAAFEGPESAALTPLEPGASIAFTTHEMSPASVLALCKELYGRAPAGYFLAIRGSEWNLAEGLSSDAARNLAAAEKIVDEFLRNL